MNLYRIHSAPLQGFTDHIWRSAFNTIFGGIDTFYSSFIRIEHGDFRRKDIRDILPENNTNFKLIPQLLACQPSDAIKIANKVQELGYNKIDINLGCPFPLIAKKHKGAGMLPFPDKVKDLFEALASLKDVEYSVKMRLGMNSATDWEEILPLLDIINPSHITVHSRIGSQQYKGSLDLDQFSRIYNTCKFPIIFNGDITSKEDVNNITSQFSNLYGIMIGRGLLQNPAMLCDNIGIKNKLKDFHTMLFEGNKEYLEGGEHQVLAKMLTYWDYLLPNADRNLRKKITKSNNLNRYSSAVEELLNNI